MNNLNQLAIEPIIASEETGKLGIKHLKRFWHKSLLKRENKLKDKVANEWQLDKTLLFALNLGLEQTIMHLFQVAPTFEEFENWIVQTAGTPSNDTIQRFNKLFNNDIQPEEIGVSDALSKDQLDFWDENGYVIIKGAVSKEDCEKTIEVICKHIDIDKDDPDTWYTYHPARQGIMVQLFQHPILSKNRQSERIRIAFEQLWGRKDIWVTADRVGFNPPETKTWKFPGPDLHWDTSLKLPIPFGLQGILYLADTEPEQGAFTLVPGFHKRIESWLNSLPAGVNPRKENLHALGSKPLAAEAGDFIIWHKALPHGSRPNRSSKPRFVQYITYSPADEKEQSEWQ